MIQSLISFWNALPIVIQIGIKIGCIIGPLLLAVLYYTYAERKVLAYMHVRIGPNRVGPAGLLQPIADTLKLLFKEIVVPTNADRYLFVIAPVLAVMPAFAAWAVIPFTDTLVLADIDASLLYVLAMTSLGVYGVIIAGGASNSKDAFFGAMRAAAQIVAYEIAMGFALVGVLMVAGSLNIREIVLAQSGGMHQWYFIPLLPLLVVYLVSGVAETNRAPFDVTEGESEIVAGPHVEYGGMGFALFFLAEYTNMLLISALTVLLFLGGWHPPFPVAPFIWVPGIFWFFGKLAIIAFLFLWFRATFPRYRYDQIMRLGWKVFIPITLVWIGVIGIFRFLTPLGFIFR